MRRSMTDPNTDASPPAPPPGNTAPERQPRPLAPWESPAPCSGCGNINYHAIDCTRAAVVLPPPGEEQETDEALVDALIQACYKVAYSPKKKGAVITGKTAILARLTALRQTVAEKEKENATLRAEVAGHEAFQRSVNDALNSGDGSYRP